MDCKCDITSWATAGGQLSDIWWNAVKLGCPIVVGWGRWGRWARTLVDTGHNIDHTHSPRDHVPHAMKGPLPVGGSYQEWTVSSHFKSYCEDFGLQVLHAWFSFSEIWIAPKEGLALLPTCLVHMVPIIMVTAANASTLVYTNWVICITFDSIRSTLRCTLLLTTVSCIAIKAEKIDLGNIIIWYAAVSRAASIWLPSGGPALLDLTSHHASIYMRSVPNFNLTKHVQSVHLTDNSV